MKGWIGFDLDGTLAYYEPGMGATGEIGQPIRPMIERVQKYLEDGHEVRIFTARMSHPERPEDQEKQIQDWLEKAGLPRLRCVCCKDYEMIRLYDDRCVQVETNTGRRIKGAFEC